MMDLKARLLALPIVEAGECVNVSDVARNLPGISTVETEAALRELVEEGEMKIVPAAEARGPMKTTLYRRYGVLGRLKHAAWAAHVAPRTYSPEWY